MTGEKKGQSLQQLDAHQRLRVAVEAGVHPRTLARALRGQPVRSTVADRIRRACVQLGVAEPAMSIAR